MKNAQAEKRAGTPGKAATEGGRRPSGVAAFPGVRIDESKQAKPDPEVRETIPRRRFAARYKLRILAECDACTEHGQLGALLRREGLYHSHIKNWRKQRDKGALDALSKKRGRKQKPKNPLADKCAALERKNRKLENELRKARIIVEYQKKMAELLAEPEEDTGMSS